MKVGEENHWRLNGIKISSIRARAKMLKKMPPIQSCYTVAFFATRPVPAIKQGYIFNTKIQAFLGSFGLLRQSL